MKKTIFYGLPGEGLGHAIRTISILEKLNPEIEVHVFTWGEAYDFFKNENYKNLHKIADLPFGRDKNGCISVGKTFCNFIKFTKNYKKSFNEIKKLATEIKPDLIISDFEPILPRVGRKLKIPYISIDNQHKFSRCYADDVSLKLKFYCWVMGLYTEFLVPNPDKAVVSTFYHTAIKKLSHKTVLTNCFMRKLLEETKPKDDNFILVYYKISSGDKLLHELKKISNIYKIKVYGCPKDRRNFTNNFEYHDIKNEEFIKDLANCSYLFCSSGNQLLGEAVFYGKPIFTVPEINQAEQFINAHFIEKLGFGVHCNLWEISLDKIKEFILNYKQRSVESINGTSEAINIINHYLGEK
jgi:uncharacterized protein (TIGR00661 family)